MSVHIVEICLEGHIRSVCMLQCGRRGPRCGWHRVIVAEAWFPYRIAHLRKCEHLDRSSVAVGDNRGKVLACQ